MLISGTVIKWNDEKGFGFIKPKSEDVEYFFHISSVVGMRQRPVIGQEVSFQAGEDRQGRKQAVNIKYAIEKRRSAHPAVMAIFTSAIFLALLKFLSAFGYIPAAVFCLYAVTSMLAFLLYAVDKSAARRGRRRTPEATLHNVAIIGGWPGALVAQQVLRHKSKKESFRSTFWFTVAINIGVLIYLLSPYGAWLVYKINHLRLWG